MIIYSYRFEKAITNHMKGNYLLSNNTLTEFIAYFINHRHKPTDDFDLLRLQSHFFFGFPESSINFIFIPFFPFTSWKTHLPR